MTLKSSSTQRKNAHRAQPALEGLEERKLLSRAPLGSSAAGSTVGVFAQDGRVFSYTTPTGGQATISVVGLGTLTGTSLTSSGRSSTGLWRHECVLQDRRHRQGRRGACAA